MYKNMCRRLHLAYGASGGYSDCIVSWAGCVQHAEGFGVSLSLGCATFPFLALLSCVSRGVNVVEKITANLPADEIIEKLNAAVDRNNQILTTARHIRQQRTETQILREQQDLEYQESLAADRRREQEAREQAEREEKERLREEEEERRAEEEARRQDEENARREEQYKAEIEAKRSHIADGPKSRTPPPGADYKTAVIKFHLHNGTRLDHIFYAHDTLKTVRDFIDVEFFDRKITIRNICLKYRLSPRIPVKAGQCKMFSFPTVANICNAVVYDSICSRKTRKRRRNTMRGVEVTHVDVKPMRCRSVLARSMKISTSRRRVSSNSVARYLDPNSSTFVTRPRKTYHVNLIYHRTNQTLKKQLEKYLRSRRLCFH
ncbi:uncharacterized protein PITG_21593 [Phytophthora infestans T30-4]|uniref:Uncharacterized protein n=1 Tax=Phytophthora infestans (strain T30-4) TaxID=403677 RepID=D0P406_PHYIT|nr:uncharacterized protein PITG_21593 [Phytophthora infestans T30-4]EEY62528.1 conserved hypothetical protein [Phytophthora infestans T30-4]|eukprot:XP_002894958.1 conserved hypothetical protein [Phytophthora infestans T30-4]